MAAMERLHQSVGSDGLEIPPAILHRYGLEHGTTAILELGVNEIRILPAILEQEAVENLALRYLLTRLGDAVTVKAKKVDDNWHISVYGSGSVEPSGKLVYSSTGILISDHSTSVKEMQQRAMMPATGNIDEAVGDTL